jgi:hypothetical protein
VTELAAVVTDDAAGERAKEKSVGRATARAVVAIVIIRITGAITAVVAILGPIAVAGQNAIGAVRVPAISVPRSVIPPRADVTVRVAVPHANAHVHGGPAMVTSIAVTICMA